MFNTTDPSSPIPAFIAKLWEMVNDKKYDYLIQWCPDGTSFAIKDQTKFCSELLPIYYKHNNMASFIRQLNKYGFRKMVPIDSASLRNDRNDLEFAHPHFIRDYPALLAQIRRKISNNKDISYNGVVTKLAQHVQQLQQKHNILESKLVSMKNENNALWREHSLLRHKHQKLQKIVNKLIQFLVTLVQQTRGLNIKRRPVPLMIKDSSKLPIQTYSVVKNKNNPVSLINEISQVESPSGCNPSEIIVPDILDEEDAKIILSDIAEYNNLSNAKVSHSEDFSEGSSLVAVPIQEVSPAIVRGKYNSKIHELPEEGNKSKDVKTVVNNIKMKKLKGKKQGTAAVVYQRKPVKILAKSNKSSTQSDGTVSTALNSLKQIADSSKNSKANEPTNSIKILSPGSFTTSPQITIEDVPIEMPEIFVLDSENIDDPHEPQVLIRESNENQRNIKIYDPNNETGDSIPEVSSLPIILSPSGTEMSPVHVSEDKTDTPLVLNDQNLAPLQKDIETMQSDLDALKEILQGENFSLDASTLLGLFNVDDPLSLNMPEAGIASGSGSFTSGNELISYNSPNLVDFIDNFDDSEPSEYTDPLSVTSQTLNTPKPDLSIDYSGPLSKRKKK